MNNCESCNNEIEKEEEYTGRCLRCQDEDIRYTEKHFGQYYNTKVDQFVKYL